MSRSPDLWESLDPQSNAPYSLDDSVTFESSIRYPGLQLNPTARLSFATEDGQETPQLVVGIDQNFDETDYQWSMLDLDSALNFADKIADGILPDTGLAEKVLKTPAGVMRDNNKIDPLRQHIREVENAMITSRVVPPNLLNPTVGTWRRFFNSGYLGSVFLTKNYQQSEEGKKTEAEIRKNKQRYTLGIPKPDVSVYTGRTTYQYHDVRQMSLEMNPFFGPNVNNYFLEVDRKYDSLRITLNRDVGSDSFIYYYRPDFYRYPFESWSYIMSASSERSKKLYGSYNIISTSPLNFKKGSPSPPQGLAERHYSPCYPDPRDVEIDGVIWLVRYDENYVYDYDSQEAFSSRQTSVSFIAEQMGLSAFAWSKHYRAEWYSAWDPTRDVVQLPPLRRDTGYRVKKNTFVKMSDTVLTHDWKKGPTARTQYPFANVSLYGMIRALKISHSVVNSWTKEYSAVPTDGSYDLIPSSADDTPG